MTFISLSGEHIHSGLDKERMNDQQRSASLCTHVTMMTIMWYKLRLIAPPTKYIYTKNGEDAL